MSIFKELPVTGQITTNPTQVQGAASIAPVVVGGNLAIAGSAEPYEGTYEVTPTTSVQVLATAGKKLADDIKINPIPSNYGLITWNGAILTVS